MSWKTYINGYKSYLKLERSLSENSVQAYLHDIALLDRFLTFKSLKISPAEIKLKELQAFIQWINEIGLGARSQARIISGVKGFFKYCLLENIISNDPAQLLEPPRLGRKLPDTLSIEDINHLLEAIDQSKPEGTRNKALL